MTFAALFFFLLEVGMAFWRSLVPIAERLTFNSSSRHGECPRGYRDTPSLSVLLVVHGSGDAEHLRRVSVFVFSSDIA